MGFLMDKTGLPEKATSHAPGTTSSTRPRRSPTATSTRTPSIPTWTSSARRTCAAMPSTPRPTSPSASSTGPLGSSPVTPGRWSTSPTSRRSSGLRRCRCGSRSARASLTTRTDCIPGRGRHRQVRRRGGRALHQRVRHRLRRPGRGGGRGRAQGVPAQPGPGLPGQAQARCQARGAAQAAQALGRRAWCRRQPLVPRAGRRGLGHLAHQGREHREGRGVRRATATEPGPQRTVEQLHPVTNTVASPKPRRGRACPARRASVAGALVVPRQARQARQVRQARTVRRVVAAPRRPRLTGRPSTTRTAGGARTADATRTAVTNAISATSLRHAVATHRRGPRRPAPQQGLPRAADPGRP